MLIIDPPFDLKIRKGKWDKEMPGLVLDIEQNKTSFFQDHRN